MGRRLATRRSETGELFVPGDGFIVATQLIWFGRRLTPAETWPLIQCESAPFDFLASGQAIKPLVVFAVRLKENTSENFVIQKSGGCETAVSQLVFGDNFELLWIRLDDRRCAAFVGKIDVVSNQHG